MSNPEKQYHRDGIAVSKEKFPYSGDIKYEDALGYLKKIALEHKGDKPVLVVLVGDRNAGKTTFIKELIEAAWKEEPERKVVIYKIQGDLENNLKKIKKLKQDMPESKFPMIVWEVTGSFSPDVQSLVGLGMLPETFIYMYDPKMEKRPNRRALLQETIKVREGISKQFRVPYEQPEVLIVQNPRAGFK